MFTSDEAAADEADEHLGEIDEAVRHAAFGHDAAGEDEERDREQREIVHAVGGLEHDGFERQVDPERRDDGGEAERVGDRHAEQAQHAEAADQDEHVHVGYSVLICEMAPSSGPSNSFEVHSRSITNRAVIAPPIGTGR